MMRRILRAGAVLALAGVPLAAGAQEVETTEAYDLLFKEGTLPDLGEGDALTYDRTVDNAANAEISARDTGEIALSIESADDRPDVARLTFWQDDKYRSMGSFPASVGNPMIMVFYETVIRDMAETAGGSPFYIRNRIKEALVQPVEVTSGTATFEGAEVPVQTVTLRPFLEDPNREAMQGFADLSMTVTMAEEVPGWYLSMTAEAPETYRSEIAFAGIGETE